MKIFPAICLLFLYLPAWAGAECLLSGTFKSDAEKTLADYTEHNSFSSPEEKRAYAEIFGSLIHEWRCTEFRMPMDGVETPWEKMTISQIDTHSLSVAFPEHRWPVLTLVFEGDCYKIENPDINYHEYFCPVEE